MKAAGIGLASEHSMRRLSAEQTGSNLAAEAVPFSFPLKNGVDLRPAPMVYVSDLVQKVIQILEQNQM